MSASSSAEALPPPVKMAKRKVHYNSGGPWTHHRTRALRKLLGRGDELFAQSVRDRFTSVPSTNRLNLAQFRRWWYACLIILREFHALRLTGLSLALHSTASLSLCSILNWWALLCMECSIVSWSRPGEMFGQCAIPAPFRKTWISLSFSLSLALLLCAPFRNSFLVRIKPSLTGGYLLLHFVGLWATFMIDLLHFVWIFMVLSLRVFNLLIG